MLSGSAGLILLYTTTLVFLRNICFHFGFSSSIDLHLVILDTTTLLIRMCRLPLGEHHALPSFWNMHMHQLLWILPPPPCIGV